MKCWRVQMTGLCFVACFWQSSLHAQERTIVTAQASFDLPESPSLELSVNSYLSRFLTMDASDENLRAAESFLKTLFFVSDSTCQFVKDTGGKKLLCLIKSKRIIRNINIVGLPASLLETELKRKLPVQLGHAIDLDQALIATLSMVKSRVETFLRKNGYYGGVVDVSEHAPLDSKAIDINVQIKGGGFARVNDVMVFGDPPIKERAIKLAYQRMCFSFSRIIESMSIGTLSCYSLELERETTQALQDRFAKMGYVQSRIRISHHWIDPGAKTARGYCQKKSDDDLIPRCINLRVDIEKGPKVRWTINVKDAIAISRNAFLRFIGSVFLADQVSRATVPPESDETALDHMIVKEELLDKITFVSSKNVDEQEIRESAQDITDFLIARGYANAEVIPTFTQEDANNILVNFDVYAGKPYFIRSVRIMPDIYVPFINEEDLQTLVATRSITDNGHLSYKEIEAAREEIEHRLTAHGFNGVKIKTDLESIDNGAVDLIFNVTSEARETVDEVIVLNGDGDLNEELLPLLYNCDKYSRPHHHEPARKPCHGSSLVRDKLDADRARFVDFYQDNGFLYAKVISEVKRVKSGYQVIFKLYDSRFGESSLVPLKRQEIKEIIISGNTRTKSSVIKRLFPTERKSAMLDPLSLKKGLANLRETGRFSRIDHKVMFGQEGSEDVYFLVQLAERPSLSFDTAIAFSTDQLFMVEAEVEQANLFSSMLRLNTSLGLGLFWGRQSIFNNKLVWPFILGKPLRFTVNAPIIVYDDRTHWDDPSRRLQSKISFGIEWRATSRITPYLKYWLGLTQEENFSKTSIPAPSFKERLASLDGLIPTLRARKDVRGVLRPGVSYIQLDNLFDPRRGVDMGVWIEFSGGPFLGSPPFINVGTQNRFFFPIGPITIALQATFMRAFIEPSKENWKELKNWSAMDKLGGDRSIRGYSEGKIGIEELKKPFGTYAGYFSNVANFEIRFPITQKSALGNFSGAFFVDQGILIPCANLFDCFLAKSIKSMISDKGFGLSIGAALRYSLPVGPISLDYGISPITGDGRLHILFGYAF